MDQSRNLSLDCGGKKIQKLSILSLGEIHSSRKWYPLSPLMPNLQPRALQGWDMSGIASAGVFASVLFWVVENFSTWESGLNLQHWQAVLRLVHNEKLKEIWEQICHTLVTPCVRMWGRPACCERELVYLMGCEAGHTCWAQNQSVSVCLPFKCILYMWSKRQQSKAPTATGRLISFCPGSREAFLSYILTSSSHTLGHCEFFVCFG